MFSLTGDGVATITRSLQMNKKAIRILNFERKLDKSTNKPQWQAMTKIQGVKTLVVIDEKPDEIVPHPSERWKCLLDTSKARFQTENFQIVEAQLLEEMTLPILVFEPAKNSRGNPILDRQTRQIRWECQKEINGLQTLLIVDRTSRLQPSWGKRGRQAFVCEAMTETTKVSHADCQRILYVRIVESVVQDEGPSETRGDRLDLSDALVAAA